jgi:hypothetical protein
MSRRPAGSSASIPAVAVAVVGVVLAGGMLGRRPKTETILENALRNEGKLEQSATQDIKSRL